MDLETLKEKAEDLAEPDRPVDVPDEAELVVEYQINAEDEFGDVDDCDHRMNLSEVADHFFLEEDHWSVEKVWMWGGNSYGNLARVQKLVAESDRPEFDFFKVEDDEHFARESFPTDKGAELYAQQNGCTYERVEDE